MEYPFKDLLPREEVTARQGYYKDWTHIDADTFHQISELVTFIREKGYGADTREAIAQALERVYHDAAMSGNANMEVSMARKHFKDLASRLDASDDKLTSATAQLAQKVGGGKLAGMADLGQDVKEAMTGGSVAVVGPNAVLEGNIVDKQVTLKKRTDMGQSAILSTRTGYKLPNYNTETHTLEIDQLIIVIGKTRHVVSNLNISCSELLDVFSSALIAYSGDKDELRVIREDHGSSLTEDFVFLGSINYSDAIASGGTFRQMNIPIQHTVDNLPSEGFSNRLIPIQLSNRPPNYKSDEQIIEFPDNVNLIINNKRYLINSGTNIDCSTVLKNHPQGAKSVAIVVCNILTNQLRPVFSANVTELSKSDVVVATIAYDNINAEELMDVQMLCRFTIDGKSYNDFFKKEVARDNVNIPTSFVNEYYTPISVQACDGTGEDGLSESSTAQDTYDLYNRLVDNHSPYVKRVTLGNDSTDTLPIYAYEFEMPDVDDQQSNDKSPILLVSGTHGNRAGVGDYQTSIFALYYFMKDLTENWKGNKLLSQLRAQFRLVVIPVVNPWGVNNKQRVNGRGVDLNRNYGPNWVQTETGDYYSGTGAFSEKESQYVKRIIDENPNALFFSDFHTRGGNVAESQMMMLLLTNNTPPSTHRLAKQTLEMCSMSFKSQFDYLNEDIWQGFIRREALAYSTSYAESKGIKSILVETFPGVSSNSNLTTNNLDVMKMSTEEIGNAVNFAISSYYE